MERTLSKFFEVKFYSNKLKIEPVLKKEWKYFHSSTKVADFLFRSEISFFWSKILLFWSESHSKKWSLVPKKGGFQNQKNSRSKKDSVIYLKISAIQIDVSLCYPTLHSTFDRIKAFDWCNHPCIHSSIYCLSNLILFCELVCAIEADSLPFDVSQGLKGSIISLQDLVQRPSRSFEYY